MRNHLTLAAVAVAAVAAPLHAQDACSEKGIFVPPAVGTWAELMAKTTEGDNKMRFAVIGKEQKDGKDYLRFEMNIVTPRGPAIVQMLASSWPPMGEGADVAEMVMKGGGMPPMRVGPMMLAQMKRMVPKNDTDWLSGDACKSVKFVGKESVTVGAGTFETRHYKNAQGAEAWVSEKAPFGIVKAVNAAEKNSVELLAVGKDAKTSITEPIQDMGAMMGRPRGN